MAVDGALAAGGDRGALLALPAKVVLDVGRVDEGGAPPGAVVATGASGVPLLAVAGLPGVESSGESGIVIFEVVKGRLVAGLADVGADCGAGLGSTGCAGVEDPLDLLGLLLGLLLVLALANADYLADLVIVLVVVTAASALVVVDGAFAVLFDSPERDVPAGVAVVQAEAIREVLIVGVSVTVFGFSFGVGAGAEEVGGVGIRRCVFRISG